MGYCADGSGRVTLKEGMDPEQVEKAIIAAYEAPERKKYSPLEYDVIDDKIEIWDSDKYHEEDTIEFLNVIAPFITEGAIEYSGESDDVWRFVFDSATSSWKEENGVVDFNFESYTDEDLIGELTKRGYTVTKKAI